ncbi:DNA polymerase I [Bienertia sinuspersici]
MAPPEEDIGWSFGEPVDGNRRRIKCKFCNKIINGGITRLKQHLAHKKGDVAPCENVSADVKKDMMALLMDYKDKKKDKRRIDREVEDELRQSIHDDEDDDPEMEYAMRQSRMHHEFDYYRGAYTRGGSSHYDERGGNLPRSLNRSTSVHDVENIRSRNVAMQPTSTPAARLRAREVQLEKDCPKKKQMKLGTGWLKKAKKELTKAFGNWMLDTNQAFRAIESPYTNPLMDTIREHPNVRAPSAYDISEVDMIYLYKDKMDSFASTSTQKAVKMMEPDNQNDGSRALGTSPPFQYNTGQCSTRTQTALSPPSSDNGGDSGGDDGEGYYSSQHSVGHFDNVPRWTPDSIILKCMIDVEGKNNLILNRLIVTQRGLDCQQMFFPSESSGSNYFGDMPNSFNNFQPSPRPDSSMPFAGYYGSASNFPYHDNVQIFNHGTINYGGVHYHQPTYYSGSSSQDEPSWMDGTGSYFFGNNERYYHEHPESQEPPRHSFWY